MKPRKKLLIYTGVLALIVPGSTLGYLFFTAPDPPEHLVASARAVLLEARQSRASRYAPEELEKAETLYNDALREWAVQNEKWQPGRDFENLARLSSQAAEYAEKALKKSYTSQEELKTRLYSDQKKIGRKITWYEKNYLRLPIETSIHKSFSRGKLLFEEGRSALARKDYLLCNRKFKEASGLVETATGKATANLSGYFKNYSRWQKWVAQTIDHSRRAGTNAIVVDKLARQCHLYQKGRLTATYEAEFGPNWLGNKHRRGDRATPEGMYKVIKCLGEGDTRYHKALLIDYPNDEDRRRFDIARKSGAIPRHARIGGSIEIHGEGGKGTHWTEGCVALENDNMDKLFPRAPSGTLVTIIGSARSLDEILIHE